MYKILFFILFLISQSSAQKVEFTESNYINALDMTTSKKGSLNFLPNSVILQYHNENKIITFNEENITVSTKYDKETLEYNENVELALFFTLVNAIFRDDIDSLKEDFDVIISKNITLIPNDYIANVIEKIQYKKNNSKLEYLKIYFTNENRIKIVQSN